MQWTLGFRWISANIWPVCRDGQNRVNTADCRVREAKFGGGLADAHAAGEGGEDLFGVLAAGVRRGHVVSPR